MTSSFHHGYAALCIRVPTNSPPMVEIGVDLVRFVCGFVAGLLMSIVIRNEQAITLWWQRVRYC